MIRILIDMNLSPAWVETFSALTHDLDFGALIAATQARTPSVIQVRAQDILPASLGAQVISAISRLHTELEEGALVSIDLGRARVRILPLRRS